MLKDIQRNLLRERKALLEQWAYASERERPHLLVRIMDIDEQLELGKSKSRPRARLPKRNVV
ncbi:MULTISPECIES: hypothetical protein [Neomoorella]|jgi:hypothetical protein|uniref:hypothetical protein n=1 Tax=Neomoorella TaxID=44260 RepID=UPI0010FFBB8C|nr:MULTISPECIES: hypothetical protein [unclassified Moorella (in: firmicutes)]MDK2816605.1 hypothetical protein [Moorella sp. (in: firmicutes)]MDK2894253.1 hypothetical protein [Moorella sp. (in: firmicutes)]GEA14306.1 hypothetical protein E308F_05480 [Moorella sp. E308F]GEA18322.1 hypothetical protein E306M_14580 [Moorella sp. E306M]